MSNVELARSTSKFIKARDKMTRLEWITRVKPLMKNVENTLIQQIRVMPSTDWEIFNLRRILDSIRLTIIDFENQFIANVVSGQGAIANLTTQSTLANSALVGLNSPIQSLLGTELIESLTPLTEAMVEFFAKDMAKTVSGSITNSIISRKSQQEAIADIKSKFGIDSKEIARLEKQKVLLKDQLTKGKITKAQYTKKLKPITRKLNSGSSMSYARAERIVRTEMATASSMAQSQTELAIGEVDPDARKMWLWSHKPTGRIDHQQVEAQTTQEPIKTDALYQVGGEEAMFPVSPELSAKQRVNCGCTSVLINVNDKEGLGEIGSIISGL